jgi:hypothetical protein
MNGLSYMIMDNPYFLSFLEAYRQAPQNARKALSRRKIAAAVDTEGKKMDEFVLRNLRHADVTLAADGWTNVKSEKVVNLICLTGSRALYWDSIYVDGSANSLNISKKIIISIEELEKEGILIVALVTDNEATMLAAADLVKQKFPYIIVLPCAAHSVQLIVKDIFKLNGPPSISATFLTMKRNVLNFVKFKNWNQKNQ